MDVPMYITLGYMYILYMKMPRPIGIYYIAFFIYLLSMIIEKKYKAEETIKLNPKPIEL